MDRPLDPRFELLVAKMKSTAFAAECESFRAGAEKIAIKSGCTFEEALAAVDQVAAPSPPPPPPPAAPPRSSGFFDGWDDWMEQREPGYKAQSAGDRAVGRQCRRRRRLATIITKYGSEEAALAPFLSERLILSAVATWRTTRPPPRDRWTSALSGFSNAWEYKKAPAHILDAIRSAIPLPKTITEAAAEFQYWETRAEEIDHILGGEDAAADGIYSLDLAAEIRRLILGDMLEHELTSTSIDDVLVRYMRFHGSECQFTQDMQDAILRDLEVLAQKGSNVSNLSTGADNVSLHPSASVHTDKIADMIRANPNQSDRHIARACNCSPTTVGKVRQQVGCRREARSVQRRGQTFTMRVAQRQHATKAT